MEKKTEVFSVNGMTCASCVRRVEKVVQKLDGIHSVSVNLATNQAQVQFDPSMVEENDIVGKINKIGFEAKVKRDNPTTKYLFSVKGMTCASCVNRVEKIIKKIEGIEDATVNLASNQAQVKVADPSFNPQLVIDKVTKLGYDTALLEEETQANDEDGQEKEIKKLKKDFTFAAIVTTFVLIGSIPHMMHGWGEWVPSWLSNALVLLILTSYVQLVPGWRFYTNSYKVLRNKSADMNVLVAMGTTSAWVYSGALTLFPEQLTAMGFPNELYYDVTTVITTLIILGRYFEAKAKGKSSNAIKKINEFTGKNC